MLRRLATKDAELHKTVSTYGHHIVFLKHAVASQLVREGRDRREFRLHALVSTAGRLAGPWRRLRTRKRAFLFSTLAFLAAECCGRAAASPAPNYKIVIKTSNTATAGGNADIDLTFEDVHGATSPQTFWDGGSWDKNVEKSKEFTLPDAMGALAAVTVSLSNANAVYWSKFNILQRDPATGRLAHGSHHRKGKA